MLHRVDGCDLENFPCRRQIRRRKVQVLEEEEIGSQNNSLYKNQNLTMKES
ncbi:unnamed protein product [Brassica oleracea]